MVDAIFGGVIPRVRENYRPTPLGLVGYRRFATLILTLAGVCANLGYVDYRVCAGGVTMRAAALQ